MSALITTELLKLEKQADSITARIEKASAVQSVTRQGSITMNGTIKRALLNPTGTFGVAEGAKKKVITPEFTDSIIMPSKKAFIYVTTMEAEKAAPEVAALFTAMAPGIFGKEFDHNVAGLVTDTNPGGIKSLASSTNTTTIEVGSAAGLKAAYGALAATGGMPTAWVLSSALYGEFISLDGTASDERLSNELVSNGTLLGLPVATFRSTAKTGFLRDWSKDEWAVAEGDVFVRTATAGEITDSEGVTHDLFLENKTAYALEGFYSFYAAPENETVVLSVPAGA